LLRIVGSCEQRLFGLTPSERLKRQWGRGEDLVLVAHAATVLSDPAIDWLVENAGTALTTPEGRSTAVACRPDEAASAAEWIEHGHAPASLNPAQLEPMFIRKLRRRDTLLVRNLEESPRGLVERELFATVYKGVTDLITKCVWPVPAFWATKACARLGVGPNAVTLVGMVLVVAVALLWLEGRILAGLGLAWLMTFLDTVDGKLARVTVTSSAVGNILDHATDIVHPPIWWICLAVGLAAQAGGAADAIWIACATILGGYVLGRLIEELFKWRIGYNAYLWRPFDSRFRLIVSRRNIILLIMSAGLLIGQPVAAFVAAAVWTVLSVGVQLVRLVQANGARSAGGADTWLK
jgi:phosphatidylglycerophosphate synthase